MKKVEVKGAAVFLVGYEDTALSGRESEKLHVSGSEKRMLDCMELKVNLKGTHFKKGKKMLHCMEVKVKRDAFLVR